MMSESDARKTAVSFCSSNMVRGISVMTLKRTTNRKVLWRHGAVAAFAATLGMMMTAPAHADYEDGLQAYKNGEFTKAQDLWVRFGSAGDIRSKLALANIYSGFTPGKANCTEFGSARLPEDDEEELKTRLRARTNDLNDTGVIVDPDEISIKPDAEKALAWYILTGYHDFYSYSQNPTTEEYEAKIVAQQCIISLQRIMRDDEVVRAQDTVEKVLAGGTDYDLFRLAMMYRAGAGLPKDNIRALQYLIVADNNARFGSSVGNSERRMLEATMPELDQKLASDLAANWQPPLPTAFEGKTPRELELARLEEEIRARELRLELASLEGEFDENEDLLQSALAALGFYGGKIDGSVGPETRNAMRAFQYAVAREDMNITPEEARDKVTGYLSNEQKVELIERAARREHPQSMYVYGIMHARGIGIPIDGAEAVRWWEKSAGNGYALSHFALGRAYQEGIAGKNPVAQNLTQSTFYYGQAAALGYAPAATELRQLRYDFNAADNTTGSQR